MLIQRSRLKWLNEGDDNSRFFHLVMKQGIRRNFLGPFITVNGAVSEVEEVREMVFDHFEN